MTTTDERTYCLIYQCRMCGTRYTEGGRMSAIDKIMSPHIITHLCEDDRKRGIADLIGFEVEE